MAWKGDPSEVETRAANEGDFASALFAEFSTSLARLGPEAEVLDLGTTMPANIHYWAHRGHRFGMVDILSKESADVDELGLSGRRFGGICCWNTLGFVPRERASVLVSGLTRLLIPGGMLFAIFDGDGRTVPPRQRYRIVNERTLRLEPSDRDIEPRAVSTSEIEHLLSGLAPTRLTVMRHGSREALGTKPRERERP